jgi:hypothetical protein
VVRASTHGIRGNTQCNGVPTAQIDHAERAPHGDVDMHIGVQIRSTWEEHAWVTVAAITDDGFEKATSNV